MAFTNPTRSAPVGVPFELPFTNATASSCAATFDRDVGDAATVIDDHVAVTLAEPGSVSVGLDCGGVGATAAITGWSLTPQEIAPVAAAAGGADAVLPFTVEPSSLAVKCDVTATPKSTFGAPDARSTPAVGSGESFSVDETSAVTLSCFDPNDGQDPHLQLVETTGVEVTPLVAFSFDVVPGTLVVTVNAIGAEHCGLRDGGNEIVGVDRADASSTSFVLNADSGTVPSTPTTLDVACSGGGGAPAAASFGTLPIAQGGSVIDDAGVTRLASGNVAILVGDIVPVNPSSTSLAVPSLQFIAGALNVQCNGTTTLDSVDFEGLHKVAGAVTVNDCDKPGLDVLLGSAAATTPALEVGALDISSNAGLGSLNLPALATVVGVLSVTNNVNASNTAGLGSINRLFALLSGHRQGCTARKAAWGLAFPGARLG